MAQVTIEGSRVTPTTFLKAGARITVEHTPYIAKMIARGYVNLVKMHESAPANMNAELEPLPEPVPSRGASREAWADFLTALGMEFDADAGRNDLIAIYDATQS